MTKKSLLMALTALILLSACGGRASTPVVPTPALAATRPLATPTTLPPTPTIAPSATPAASPTPTLDPTLAYPIVGMGPSGFAADVDPLTGQKVPDPTVLDRRPIVIKVENLPREHRPQFGLSLADIVYEYYTEQGGTRFAAVYYGANAEKVGPIRSGRFFDVNVVQMYRGIFIFGSAYFAVWSRFVNSDFADRLVLENQYSCPGLCRFEPQGRDLLLADTKAIAGYIKMRGMDNQRQTLDGMFFQLTAPAGGDPAAQVFVRYSGAIYNRWDYDPTSGRYLRFSDSQNDIDRNNEKYAQLTDQLTGKPIAADTLVTLCTPHEYYYKSSEMDVVDMPLDPAGGTYTACDGKQYSGATGPAWVARDGKIYKVLYKRTAKNTPLALLTEDGRNFPFKPGQTWFEVIGASSKVEQQANNAWRFTFAIAP